MDDDSTRPMTTAYEAGETRRAEPAGPHVATLVLGVVLAAVAALVALGELVDIEIDLGLILPVGMIATGVLLVVGALLSGFRRHGSGR